MIEFIPDDTRFLCRPSWYASSYEEAYIIFRAYKLVGVKGIRFFAVAPSDVPLSLRIKGLAAWYKLKIDGCDTPPITASTLASTHGILAPDGKLWHGEHNAVMEYLTGQTQLVEQKGYIRLRNGRWETVLYRQWGIPITDKQYDALHSWFAYHKQGEVPSYVLEDLLTPTK